MDSVETLQTELMPRIPHANMQIIPGTGHLSPLESAGEVATLIDAFVRTLD